MVSGSKGEVLQSKVNLFAKCGKSISLVRAYHQIFFGKFGDVYKV